MATFGKLLLGLDIDQKGAKRVYIALNRVINETEKLNNSTIKLAKTLTGPLRSGFDLVKQGAIELAKETYNVGTSFEQAIQTVKAISGETAENMRLLEMETRKLGSTTSFTATEAANAMTTLARSGMKAQQLLSTTSSALLFAGAASTTLDKSASLLAATLKQFTMQTEQSAYVTDVFTTALKESLFDMQSLTAAMRYGGSVGSSFNMTLEETVASLAMFRNLGLEGSMAGTQFRMAMSKASKETNRGRAVLEKYNLSYKDINPTLNTFMEIMEKVGKVNMSVTDIIAVFGVRSAGSIAKISREAVKLDNEYDKLMTSMRLGAGVTQQVYDEVQNTVERQMLVVKSAQEEIAITMFESFKNPLRDLLKTVSETLNKVSQAFQFLSFSETNNAINALSRSIESVGPSLIKAYIGFYELVIETTKALSEMAPAIISFVNVSITGLKLLVRFFRILNYAVDGVANLFSGLINILQLILIPIKKLAVFVGILSETESKVTDVTLALDRLFALIAGAITGGAMYIFLISLGKLVVLFGRVRFAVQQFRAVLIATRVAMTGLDTATKALTASQLLLGGGYLKIATLVLSIVASIGAYSFAMSGLNEETNEAINLNEQLQQALSKTREQYTADVDGNVTTKESIQLIDQYIQKIKNSSDALTENQKNTIKSLEQTKSLTTEQTKQGVASGHLVEVQSRLTSGSREIATAYISVRDALSMSSDVSDDFGISLDNMLDQIQKTSPDVVRLEGDLHRLGSSISQLKSLRIRLDEEDLSSGLGSLLSQMNLLGDSVEETDAKIVAQMNNLNKEYRKTKREVNEIYDANDDLKDSIFELGGTSEEIKAIINRMAELNKETAQYEAKVKSSSALVERWTQLSQMGISDDAIKNTHLLSEGFGVVDGTLNDAKSTLQGYIQNLNLFRKTYEGILSQLLLGEEELNKPTEDSGSGTVDARYKNMYEARLKLMEKVAKRERDVFALNAEVERNKLQDRFKEIHDHFKKEMALYKKGSAQRRRLARQERALIAQEYSSSLNERMNSFASYTSNLISDTNKQFNNELQNIEQVKTDKIKALQAETSANKSLADIKDASLKGETKSERQLANVAKLRLKSLVDSAKQLEIVSTLQEEANAFASERARKELQMEKTGDSPAIFKAKQSILSAEREIAKAKAEQARYQSDLDDLEGKTGEEARIRIGMLQAYISEIEVAKKGALKENLNLAKQALAEQEALEKEAFEDEVARRTKFVDIAKLVHDKIGRSRNILYRNVAKIDELDLKKRKFNLAELTQYGISEDNVKLLNKMLVSSKEEVITLQKEKAIRAIEREYSKKKRDLDKETLDRAKKSTEELLGNQKTLYQRLRDQQDIAVEEARKSSDELADRTKKIYDDVIPKVVQKAVDDLYFIYGKNTEDILLLEEQLLQSRNRNITNLFNDTTSNIEESVKAYIQSFDGLSGGEIFEKITNDIKKSFVDFGVSIGQFGTSIKQSLSSWGSFVSAVKAGSKDALSSSMNILSFINPYKSFNQEIIQIEIDKEKKLDEFRKRRKKLEADFDIELLELKVKAGKDLTGVERQQFELAQRIKDEEAQYVKDTEAKKTQVIFAALQKTVEFAKNYANTIMGFYTKVFNGLTRIASIGTQAFSKLTGFSFNFDTALGDIVSKMDEVNEKQKEIQQGVVDARFSPEQAAEGMAGVAQSPAQLATEFIDNLIEKSFTFIDTFAEAGPELIRRLGERLPEITAKLAETLPQAIQGFMEALPILIDGIAETASQFITIIIELLPDLIDQLVEVLSDKLPDIIEVLIEKLPQIATSLLNAIVEVLPILLTGFIRLLPTLLRVGINAIIQLIPLIINAFVFELIPMLPMIAKELVVGIVKGIGVLLLSVVKSLGDFLGFDTSGLADTINNIGGGSTAYNAPTGFYSGINYVPQRMLAELHQGEAVIPADVNARRMGGAQNPALAGSSALGARGSNSAPQPIDIAVMAEGRLLDSVQVLAMDRGHAPKLNKRFQRASGVKVGFSRGKFSKYN